MRSSGLTNSRLVTWMVLLMLASISPDFGQEPAPESQSRDSGYRPGIRAMANGQKASHPSQREDVSRQWAQ